MRWYGLIDGKPYYEGGGVVEAHQRIAKELGMTPKAVGEARDEAFEKLTKSENFNLLPEEAKKLAKL